MGDITLRDALCGFSFAIKHLDGRTLVVKSEPGEVVEPNAIKMIAQGGMPIHGTPFEFGNLYIFFKVHFPEKLGKSEIEMLSKALPKQVGAVKESKFTGDENADMHEVVDKLVDT